MHIDGARDFQRGRGSGASVSRIARHADSVMFCLSKALGAPVGSLLVGTAEAIAQGRLYRKRSGGGMRQAGVLAAAGSDGARRFAFQLPARSRECSSFLLQGSPPFQA